MLFRSLQQTSPEQTQTADPAVLGSHASGSNKTLDDLKNIDLVHVHTVKGFFSSSSSSKHIVGSYLLDP